MDQASSHPPWYRSTLPVALAGSVLMASALPPLSWAPLAWLAPVPWLFLVRRNELTGRRPYLAVWLAGFVFWLLAIHWLRLPHPAVYLGWVALSAYLACYLPVFVGLSRVAVHQVGLPLWLAAPVVWTGLELARAHVMTGFLMGSLAHTQVGSPSVIQISDLVGEYGVDFIMMAVAASIACVLTPPRKWLAILPGGILLAAALVYGHTRLNAASAAAKSDATRPARIALIQGNSLAEWKYDASREQQIMDEYYALSQQAVDLAATHGDGRPLDLVVWPETMFRTPLIIFDPGYKPPANATRTPEEIASYGPASLAALARRLDTPVLVGVERIHQPANAADGSEQPLLRYNSAALVGRDGKIVGTYDKVHRVVFGEYIPFSKWFPWLYTLAPVAGRIDAGSQPVVLELDGRYYAPNICYETVIPHVIRRQARTAAANGSAPDVLVNVTNDSWYWGSSELDMHLACGVFRAVETRTPLVIAANGGISAWIDQWGRVRAQSPRQKPDVIIADVENFPQRSLYMKYGDWFAGLCLICCVTFAIVGWWNPRQMKLESAIAAHANARL